MPTLSQEFTFDRHLYQSISREGDIAIYKQLGMYGSIHYEVVKIQHRPERRLPDGRVQPAGEYYPKSEQWGTAGWTFYTLEDAQQFIKDHFA